MKNQRSFAVEKAIGPEREVMSTPERAATDIGAETRIAPAPRHRDPGRAPAEAFDHTSFASRLAALESDTRRGSVRFLATEHVTALRVSLPVRGRRRRAAALPFAIEEQLGAALDTVVVVEAPLDRADPDTVLALVVARLTVADAKAPARARLVPDMMAIPRPEPAASGPAWSVWRDAGRDVVRVSDGAGFAIASAMFVTLWQRAGCPQVNRLGAVLPAGVPVSDLSASPPAADPRDLAFTLGQDDRTRTGATLRRPLWRIAAILAFGLLAHLALAAVDLAALNRIAASERSLAQAALDRAMPGLVVGTDTGAILARLAPNAPTMSRSDFLPLLSDVSGALLDHGRPLRFRRLSYGSAEGVMALQVEAAGLDDLQAIEGVLSAGGFAVTSGAATAGDGGAEVELRVARGAGG